MTLAFKKHCKKQYGRHLFVNAPVQNRQAKSEKNRVFQLFDLNFLVCNIFFCGSAGGRARRRIFEFLDPFSDWFSSFCDSRNTGFYSVFLFSACLTASFKTSKNLVNYAVLCYGVNETIVNTRVFWRWLKKHCKLQCFLATWPSKTMVFAVVSASHRAKNTVNNSNFAVFSCFSLFFELRWSAIHGSQDSSRSNSDNQYCRMFLVSVCRHDWQLRAAAQRCGCRRRSDVNMSRLSLCRVWWSRPDKLRQPSFEEVDSAVKRLETQRLNLNCLGNGCNMKPMETLRKPPGKDWKIAWENASLDLWLQWKCNGIYNVESCGTNMSLSKNMYCWEDCQQSAGQLALCTSSCGSTLWLCAVPKPNGLGIAFKENDRKKTCDDKWETLCYG